MKFNIIFSPKKKGHRYIASIQGSPKPILEYASDTPFITEHRLSFAFPGFKTKQAILDGTPNVSTYFIRLSNRFGQFNITVLTNQEFALDCGAADDSPWTAELPVTVLDAELPVMVLDCGAADDSPWTAELPKNQKHEKSLFYRAAGQGFPLFLSSFFPVFVKFFPCFCEVFCRF